MFQVKARSLTIEWDNAVCSSWVSYGLAFPNKSNLGYELASWLGIAKFILRRNSPSYFHLNPNSLSNAFEQSIFM
jgi:hypothetical protein